MISRNVLNTPMLQSGQGPLGTWLVGISVGLALGLGLGILRIFLSPLMDGETPFALVFVSVAAATILAGWRAGLFALFSGHALIWYVVFAPRFSFALTSSRQAVAIGVTMLSELLVLAVIAYYQSEVHAAGVARSKVEAELQLVVQEMNHRVKNTLAVVGGIARQTFREAASETTANFQGRLAALARAHDLIAQRQDDRVSIDRLVHTCMQPYCPSGQSRVRIAGPKLEVSPALAVNLALGLNELATNATKYGALSVDQGLVQITWSLTDTSMLSLTWAERGGPTVTPPTRKGFGTRLIQSGLRAQSGGKVDISFGSAGVVCTIVAPL